MKTALSELKEKLESKANDPMCIQIESDVFKRVSSLIDLYLPAEKQQHEQTAIHITNVLMDALDNQKGGKFSGEEEFNKYWEDKYTTNK